MREPIDPERVRALVSLAGLDLDDDEIRRLGGDLASILEHVARVAELEFDARAPARAGAAIPPRWREDEPGAAGSAEAALNRAPQADAGHFVVPRAFSRDDG